MRYIKIIQAVLFITLLTGVAAACSDDTPAGEDNSTEQGGNGATDKDNPDNNGNSDTETPTHPNIPLLTVPLLQPSREPKVQVNIPPAARAVLSMW
ncbi:hypothetical protein [Bacteroides sp. 44_46]|uniref:hypothetical protein n=1 Tax=Bacteroides sp. 44_46 TaxID=1897052 RepID=UPI00095C0939|nr:hypothetical protein [Bacteroides sp. 44_46]OKY98289.1 MAG: hypothetical protein BHV73_11170 [Bacteroides sp. 44_46]